MTSTENRHPLAGLAEGLRLNYPELGILVDNAHQKRSPYDFFSLLTTQIVPYLRKQKAFSTLVNRWERQCRDYRRKQEILKKLAIEEVNNAAEKLTTRLESSPQFKTTDVINVVSNAKGYLDGTIPACMPPYYESAANELATACRLLLQSDGHELLEGIAEATSVTESQKINGVWQAVETPCLEKCLFENAISKLKKEQSKWSWDCYNHDFVCWSYLRLAEKCWNLKEEDFANTTLEYKTVEEGQRSAELLVLHGFWIELLVIKDRRSGDTPFFTIDRFSKYLEVVLMPILTQPATGRPSEPLLGVTAIALALDGEYLLLVVERDGDAKPTRHRLHKFNGASYPRSFIDKLIANPGEEVTPSDIGMFGNSCANLIKRAKLTGALKELLIKKGQRKDSVTLPCAKVALKEQGLALRLKVQQQLEEMNLPVYQGL